jgi:hypothetical protein
MKILQEIDASALLTGGISIFGISIIQYYKIKSQDEKLKTENPPDRVFKNAQYIGAMDLAQTNMYIGIATIAIAVGLFVFVKQKFEK